MKISRLILCAIAFVAIITSCGSNTNNSKQTSTTDSEAAIVDTLKNVFNVILEGEKGYAAKLNQKDEAYVESFLMDSIKKNEDDYYRNEYRPQDNGYHWIGLLQLCELEYDSYTLEIIPSKEEKGAYVVTIVMNPEMKDGESIETHGGYSHKWKQTTKNIVRTTLCEDGVTRISSYELLSSEGNPYL